MLPAKVTSTNTTAARRSEKYILTRLRDLKVLSMTAMSVSIGRRGKLRFSRNPRPASRGSCGLWSVVCGRVGSFYQNHDAVHICAAYVLLCASAQYCMYLGPTPYHHPVPLCSSTPLLSGTLCCPSSTMPSHPVILPAAFSIVPRTVD